MYSFSYVLKQDVCSFWFDNYDAFPKADALFRFIRVVSLQIITLNVD